MCSWAGRSLLRLRTRRARPRPLSFSPCSSGAARRYRPPGRRSALTALPRWLHRIDWMMSETLAPVAHRSVSLTGKLRQYYALTKPRVVQLIVFCALIGMLLAAPGLPDWHLAIAGVAGIWLVAAAAAAFNCLVEQRIAARIASTSRRATATGGLTTGPAPALSAA